jgi:hypothetical protein
VIPIMAVVRRERDEPIFPCTDGEEEKSVFYKL